MGANLTHLDLSNNKITYTRVSVYNIFYLDCYYDIENNNYFIFLECVFIVTQTIEPESIG